MITSPDAPAPNAMNRLTTPIARLLLPMVLGLCSFFGAASLAHADELSEVHRLHYAGQTAAALQRADQYLAANPKDAAMRFLKGVMLTDARRTAEAMTVFQKLIEDFPDLAEPYNNLASLYAASGDYDNARSSLEQALRANPDYASARENLGDVYAMLASRSYALALRLEPGNAVLPRKLALVRELVTPAKAAASAATP